MRSLSDSKLEHLRSIAASPDFSSTKYRIVGELARGGMGIIYQAEDPQLGREIAIKVLNTPEEDSDLARRMIREAQIIARLEHPGIVPVHDVGVLADGSVFYAMKLVRGQRLDEYAIQTQSLNDRLRKFQAACEAVAFAHAHGVIHRDLKPQNIMIGSFGEVLVMDWGIAKMLRSNQSTSDSSEPGKVLPPGRRGASRDRGSGNGENTTHGTIVGTAGYMAPEQARGEIEKLDERSDVYSLGAVLYFLLTNKPPAGANSTDESATFSRPTLRPRELNPKISKTAEAVCLKAMSPAGSARYSSATELVAEIARLIDDQPVNAHRENVFERTGRWFSKNRFLVFLILAYLLMRFFFILTSRR